MIFYAMFVSVLNDVCLICFCDFYNVFVNFLRQSGTQYVNPFPQIYPTTYSHTVCQVLTIVHGVLLALVLLSLLFVVMYSSTPTKMKS